MDSDNDFINYIGHPVAGSYKYFTTFIYDDKLELDVDYSFTDRNKTNSYADNTYFPIKFNLKY